MTKLVLLLAMIVGQAGAFAAVKVTPADAPMLKKAILAQHGHVVVVNFWATWCGPCVAEFPALVKLQDSYRSKGLVVMAVSADRLADLHSKVYPFLLVCHAKFPQYLQRSIDPQDVINAFDPDWQGDLPRTFIYDKRGRLVRELVNGQTLAQFKSAVAPLLGGRAP